MNNFFFENIKLAAGNFAHSKLRTALSGLGIIIGVMSVIAITTLGGSATESITDSVMGAGLNSITVMAGRDASTDVTRTFTLEFADDIAADVEGVEAVVSGKAGPNAYEVLKQAGIDIFLLPPGLKVKDALEKYKAGSLRKMEITQF